MSGIGNATDSYTAAYLRGDLKIDIPATRRRWRDAITVNGAREHNLKNIDVRFPLGVMTVVTGVSGSGKSTLVRDILYRAMVRHLGDPCDAPGLFNGLSGDSAESRLLNLWIENPIGRCPLQSSYIS